MIFLPTEEKDSTE